MKRRDFITLLDAAAASPLAARAQHAKKISRIGVLWPNPPATFEFMRQGLRERGYIEGQSIRFEFRWAEGKLDQLPELARELVGIPVDVIVTLAPPATVAARNATQTIPIVFVAIGEPVASGLVATGYPEREYFRPNFFVNTPDILPLDLQSGEPWIFKARVALAAVPSGNYGIYNGFELLEHQPIPSKKEYLNSEKYELKVRDWNKPGNIKNYIGDLNRIRQSNPALLQTSRLRFAQIDDKEVIGFVKESIDGHNAVAVALGVKVLP